MNNTETAEEMIKMNNLLREQLTTENKKYYSDLLIYIRTAGLFYNDKEIESSLLEILQDMLNAQQDGVNAREYFGKEPKETADQLISKVSKIDHRSKFKLFGYIFGISTLFYFIGEMSSNTNQLNLLPIVLNGIATVGLIQLIMWGIHKSIYTKTPTNKVIKFFIFWLLGIVMLGLFIGIQFIQPKILAIPIHLPVFIIMIIAFLIVFTGIAAFGKNGVRF